MAEKTTLIAQATQAFARLTEREKKLALLTSIVAFVFIVAGIVYVGGNALSSREARIKQHREQLQQIEALRGKYDEAVATERRNTLRIHSNSTSLFTLLQKSATELGLQLNDLNERRAPKEGEVQEVSADVNFKEISIDKLNDFFEKVEGKRQDGVVKVTKLKVKTRFEAPDMLEVAMTVTTWKASGTVGANGAAAPAAAAGKDEPR